MYIERERERERRERGEREYKNLGKGVRQRQLGRNLHEIWNLMYLRWSELYIVEESCGLHLLGKCDNVWGARQSPVLMGPELACCPYSCLDLKTRKKKNHHWLWFTNTCWFRPKWERTSSTMSATPNSLVISRRPLKNAGLAQLSPPSAWIGSTITPATGMWCSFINLRT